MQRIAFLCVKEVAVLCICIEDLKDNSKDNRFYLHLSDILACMFVVSMMIPQNERRMEGPLIFDGFTGLLICS